MNHWWIVVGVLGASVTLHAQAQSFSCEGRTSGYYADVGTGCQVYHMCDGLGRQFSYTCPNATLFQQRMLICDHWYMVNCSKSEDDYSANLLIGQRDTPFVEDSESHPYHRTPRPDLLAHPSDSEFNIIYRTGRAHLEGSNNIVGAETNDNENSNYSTEKPVYFLPSHWSTEYSKQYTTENPVPNNRRTNRPIAKKGTTATDTKAKGKAIQNFGNNFNSNLVTRSPVQNFETRFKPNSVTDVPVNFKSFFKNTTPVYPTSVDITTEEPNDAGILPPLPYARKNNRNFEKEKEQLSTVRVNYESNFTATTPVYPTSVEATSPNPGEVGLLPPQSDSDAKETAPLKSSQENVGVPELSLDFLPPKEDDSYKTRNHTETVEVTAPSIFYQPPKFEPDFTQTTETNTPPPQTENNFKKVNKVKPINSDEWKHLRKVFLIPDYDFPLETVSRPSYDSKLSSFQVKPVKKR